MIAGLPVFCSCGREDNGEGFTNLEEYETERINKCYGCENHNVVRCKLIKLGCCPAYLEQIRNKNASCPIGVWGPVE
jgi:hypothetical protein